MLRKSLPCRRCAIPHFRLPERSFKIERWQKGYTATTFKDGSCEENAAVKDKFNEKLGVSKAQEQAMVAGSMFGWDKPAAKPKNYDENGKPIKPKNKDYER